MQKLSMTGLLNSIDSKFIVPAIAQRRALLYNYLKNINEETLLAKAINLNYMKGNFYLHNVNYQFTHSDTHIRMFLYALPDYNQVETLKQLELIFQLESTLEQVRVYLSYLNNKANNLTDIAHALPAHINQLVPMATPATFEETDLRDPKLYSLLNELQIKLLLLS
tara:strand:+ start:5964 stop:6461 length:498 start_codon:yes stop_codon:yes gene_type:complete